MYTDPEFSGVLEIIIMVMSVVAMHTIYAQNSSIRPAHRGLDGRGIENAKQPGDLAVKNLKPAFGAG